MSDVASNFAMYRFVLSAILATGGIACIYFGYRLFSSGSGLSRGLDKFSLKNRDFQVSAAGMSVGGVLMTTSAFWAYFAYASVAKLEIAGDRTLITEKKDASVVAQGNAAEGHSAVGANVYTIGAARPVGKVIDVLVDKSARATGYVVTTDGGKTVLVRPALLEFGDVPQSNEDAVIVRTTREQLDRLPELKGWEFMPLPPRGGTPPANQQATPQPATPPRSSPPPSIQPGAGSSSPLPAPPPNASAPYAQPERAAPNRQ